MGISQAVDLLPEYGRRKRGETWVLTRRGRPVAAVVPIDAEDYFGVRLASDPRFIEIIERSRASYEATGGASLGEMRRRYGVPAKPGRWTAPRKHRWLCGSAGEGSLPFGILEEKLVAG